MRPLGAALERRGWSVVVPDLRGAVGSPRAFRDHAAASASEADVVVGHSGAGALLPSMADVLDATMVFVDAIVPPAGTVYESSPQLIALVDALPVVDGLLPPWHAWWPADALAELVPDEALRTRVVSEIPQLPRAFFDEPVPLPAHFERRSAVYLQLSAAYGDDRARAEGWEWPTAHVDGRHLDLCVEPERTADFIRDLLDHLAAGSP